MNPLELPNLAAWYDLALSASTTSSDIRIDGSNRVSLIADKSGNSATNCLNTNGRVGGNGATLSALTAFGTGNFTVEVEARPADLSAAEICLLGGGFSSFSLTFNRGGGGLLSAIITNGAMIGQVASGVSLYQRAVFGYTRSGTTGTFYVNGVQVGSTIVDSTNYTVGQSFIGQNGNGLNWNGAIFAARVYGSALTAGQMLANAGGSITAGALWDVNFALATKLATSFTATAGGTVTINSSGDLGARISGERDLVQLTASKQPIYLPWSGTNYGYVPGISGSFFSTPNAAAIQLAGSIDVRWNGYAANWSATNIVLAARHSSNGTLSSNSWMLRLTSGGAIGVDWRDSGGTTYAYTATPTGFTNFSTQWVRFTLNVTNNQVTLFQSTDGVTWTQFGQSTAGSAITLNAGSADFTIGQPSNNIWTLTGAAYRCQLLSGIGGTVVADFNPSRYTSGTTFTASTGEVWTLNGGATIVNRTSLYFDGSDDYMKAAAFSLGQPETVYFTGQQVSWTANRTLFDGGVNLSSAAIQSGTTPTLVVYSDPGTTASNSGLSIATSGVVTQIVGTSSVSIRVNRGSSSSANGTTAAANGFTLASRGAGSSQLANIRANEVCIYSAAHDTSVQDRVIQYAGRKWGISGV